MAAGFGSAAVSAGTRGSGPHSAAGRCRMALPTPSPGRSHSRRGTLRMVAMDGQDTCAVRERTRREHDSPAHPWSLHCSITMWSRTCGCMTSRSSWKRKRTTRDALQDFPEPRGPRSAVVLTHLKRCAAPQADRPNNARPRGGNKRNCAADGDDKSQQQQERRAPHPPRSFAHWYASGVPSDVG